MAYFFQGGLCMDQLTSLLLNCFILVQWRRAQTSGKFQKYPLPHLLRRTNSTFALFSRFSGYFTIGCAPISTWTSDESNNWPIYCRSYSSYCNNFHIFYFMDTKLKFHDIVRLKAITFQYLQKYANTYNQTLQKN